MKIFYSSAVLVSLLLCTWLFLNEEAAKPGPLSVVHRDIEQCDVCHVPWQEVSEDMCLQCHEFAEAAALRPTIRYHEAEKNCLKCHTEHRGEHGKISQVDHTLFSGKLQCARCHGDIHSGLFGNDCRKCHGIKSWDVPGYKHPPLDKKNCNRCHKAPYSHQDQTFWRKIERTHGRALKDVPHEDCWRCHTIHNWHHLIMPHKIGENQRP